MGFMGNRMGFIRPGKHTVKAIEHGPVEIVFPLKMVIHQRVRFTKLFRSSVRPPVWFSSMGPMSPRPSSLHLWRCVAPVPSHPPRWRWRPTARGLPWPPGIAYVGPGGMVETLLSSWSKGIHCDLDQSCILFIWISITIYICIYICMYIYIYIYQ